VRTALRLLAAFFLLIAGLNLFLVVLKMPAEQAQSVAGSLQLIVAGVLMLAFTHAARKPCPPDAPGKYARVTRT
jgi:uncharacterized protein YhhL (DUF1145 family)